jgi:hypothetical protein
MKTDIRPIPAQEAPDYYYHAAHLPYENMQGGNCDAQGRKKGDCYHRKGEVREITDGKGDTTFLIFVGESLSDGAGKSVEIIDVTTGQWVIHELDNSRL